MAKKNKIAAPPAWLAIGAIVDYCSIIGREPTERAIAVQAGPKQIGTGDWVVWLTGKSGAVSVLACHPAASNDVLAEVKVEIRAAMLEHDRKDRRVGERWGWEEHELNDDVTDNEFHLAGWLHRELATHDYRKTRDATAWAWDITRPLSGQYEEYVQRSRPDQTWCPEHRTVDCDACQIGSVHGDIIASQTRHDVAALVVRHAEDQIDATIDGVLVLPPKTPAEEIAEINYATADEVLGGGMGASVVDIILADDGETAAGQPPALPMLTPEEERAENDMANADCALFAEFDEHAIDRHLSAHGLVRINVEIGDEPEHGVEFDLASGPHADVKTLAQELRAIDAARRKLIQIERAEVEHILSDICSDDPLAPCNLDKPCQNVDGGSPRHRPVGDS